MIRPCCGAVGIFHGKKKYQKVDEMLFRIYEPILWRALKVANPTVRKQAALLFIDAFPVQNPEASQADFEQVKLRTDLQSCLLFCIIGHISVL